MKWPLLSGPKISVVIPTFNRPHELHLCLEGFARQTTPKSEFEVVIVDDGSPLDIKSVANRFASTLNLQFIRIAQNGGPGAARNIAIQRARSPLLVLYDDDLKPLPELVEYCLEFHKAHPAREDSALLLFQPGPQVAPSQTLAWGFNQLYPFPRERCVTNWVRFWSGTLSCKKSLFREEKFNPSYRMLEDAELGLRLSHRLDLRVHFEPQTLGLLTRAFTFPQILRRSYGIGFYSHVLARDYRGRANFAFPPYNEPERYVLSADRLKASLSAARALESGGSPSAPPSNMLCALLHKADLHAKASGWIAARDEQPCEPPQDVFAPAA